MNRTLLLFLLFTGLLVGCSNHNEPTHPSGTGALNTGFGGSGGHGGHGGH
ncbi:Uncharacterised protein [Legionella busanensis]|uniref:Lipoprotein n=2 Tax=Legionella TaxID=445 RepID=A0A378KAW7_9GAMM|nr:hypothetical protein [Legionella busanensis]STX81649.1 Uncharacterised protein [Legionella busanensis]